MAITAAEFRRTLGTFPTGVTVCTTTDAAGAPVGVTVSSFTSVSLDPPLILFCLGREAEVTPTFLGGRAFAVNILSAEQQALSERFAFEPADARWQGVGFTLDDAGCPILDGCLASLVCRLEATHDGGDHHILVGRVLRLSWRDGQPLVYVRGSYATVTTAAAPSA